MNTQELQQLKRAWIAAKESGDSQTQLSLLHDHPEAQDRLIEFIAAYSATASSESEAAQFTALLPLTQRACQSALDRVFDKQLAAATLQELRTLRGLSMVSAAKGLRLGVDVWKKFESGAIELVSLSERQLERLARFFQVSVEQFGTLLNNSQPTLALNRRQTAEAARSEQQAPRREGFAEAIKKSSMSKEEKGFWLEK